MPCHDQRPHTKRPLWTKVLLAAATGTVLALGACNTMEGVGQDMQAAGRGLEKEAKDAND